MGGLAVAAGGYRTEWATSRFGPVAWLIVGGIVAGAIYWYCQQPAERRDRISKVAGQIGSHLLTEFGKAGDGVQQARLQLRACVVPQPEERSIVSSILRELALSPESLSAQELAGLLAPQARPSVTDLRPFLRTHDGTVFTQVRRGGFVLGSRYQDYRDPDREPAAQGDLDG